MNNEQVYLLTPVVRFTAGSPFEKNINSKYEGGKDKFYCEYVLDKTSPDAPKFLAEFQKALATLYPRNIKPDGTVNIPKFAYKIFDGDASDKAKPWHKGGWVIPTDTKFAPKIYAKGGKEEIRDSNALKCGYYVRAYMSIVDNAADVSKGYIRGVFINTVALEIIGYGEEIEKGYSYDEQKEGIFSNSKITYVPSGVKAVPEAATNSDFGGTVKPRPSFLNAPQQEEEEE